MQTIIDRPERHLHALGHIAMICRLSRVELSRQGLYRYLAEHAPDLGAAFGLWRRAGFRDGGVGYQKRFPAEWKRGG